MIYINDYIYIIVPDGDSGKIKQLKYQCGFETEPKPYTLKEYYDFSPDPSDHHSNCLCYLGPNEPLFAKNERRRAYAHECTMKRVRQENSHILAFSHQKGGWTGFDWEFNNDIRFHVSTNFGYGRSSYFFLQIHYKGYQLTPYSHYVLYQYADIHEICRYTYSYCVDYSSWPKTMQDAEDFYNAVVNHQDIHVLEWIKKHLSKMLTILDEFIHSDCGSYESNFVEDMKKKRTDIFSGDKWWITKTEKIVGSTDFINNIRHLPIEIEPELYVKQLIDVNRKFLPLLKEKNIELNKQINSFQIQIDEESQLDHYPLYEKLYDKYYYKRQWYSSANKVKMFRTLLSIHHRLQPIYNYQKLRMDINKCIERKDSISKLKNEKNVLKNTYQFLKSKEDKLVNNLETHELEYEN